MAAGDAVGYINNIASATYDSYQPAAGVEICITNFGIQSPADAYVYIYDGTWQVQIVQPTSTISNNGSPVKVIITNSIYVRFYNGSTGPRGWGFTGIQLK
jgi:hypothetical protein